jgi:hypothetical protein
MNDLKKPLGLIPVPDELVKHDFEVLGRYQAFSSELLRIALLAIPSLGFLLTYFFLHHDETVYLNAFRDGRVRFCSSAALICFGISSAFALGHRYISTDSMTSHLICLRLAIRNAEGDAQTAKKERAARDRRFLLSALALGASALALFVGAVLLAISFAYAISYIGHNA